MSQDVALPPLVLSAVCCQHLLLTEPFGNCLENRSAFIYERQALWTHLGRNAEVRWQGSVLKLLGLE